MKIKEIVPREADRWTFHVRAAHDPCKVGICACSWLKKSPSALFAKAAFRSSVSLCRQLLLLFRQIEERRLTLAPLALDARSDVFRLRLFFDRMLGDVQDVFLRLRPVSRDACGDVFRRFLSRCRFPCCRPGCRFFLALSLFLLRSTRCLFRFSFLARLRLGLLQAPLRLLRHIFLPLHRIDLDQTWLGDERFIFNGMIAQVDLPACCHMLLFHGIISPVPWNRCIVCGANPRPPALCRTLCRENPFAIIPRR